MQNHPKVTNLRKRYIIVAIICVISLWLLMPAIKSVIFPSQSLSCDFLKERGYAGLCIEIHFTTVTLGGGQETPSQYKYPTLISESDYFLLDKILFLNLNDENILAFNFILTIKPQGGYPEGSSVNLGELDFDVPALLPRREYNVKHVGYGAYQTKQDGEIIKENHSLINSRIFLSSVGNWIITVRGGISGWIIINGESINQPRIFRVTSRSELDAFAWNFIFSLIIIAIGILSMVIAIIFGWMNIKEMRRTGDSQIGKLSEVVAHIEEATDRQIKELNRLKKEETKRVITALIHEYEDNITFATDIINNKKSHSLNNPPIIFNDFSLIAIKKVLEEFTITDSKLHNLIRDSYKRFEVCNTLIKETRTAVLLKLPPEIVTAYMEQVFMVLSSEFIKKGKTLLSDLENYVKKLD